MEPSLLSLVRTPLETASIGGVIWIKTPQTKGSIKQLPTDINYRSSLFRR